MSRNKFKQNSGDVHLRIVLIKNVSFPSMQVIRILGGKFLFGLHGQNCTFDFHRILQFSVIEFRSADRTRTIRNG